MYTRMLWQHWNTSKFLFILRRTFQLWELCNSVLITKRLLIIFINTPVEIRMNAVDRSTLIKPCFTLKWKAQHLNLCGIHKKKKLWILQWRLKKHAVLLKCQIDMQTASQSDSYLNMIIIVIVRNLIFARLVEYSNLIREFSRCIACVNNFFR